MPDPEAVAEVALGWLRRARSDLVMARKALAGRAELDPWVASFHAQQAAEKYLKAALVIEQIRFPRTHELERLRPLLPTAWALPDQEALAGLSRFAVAGRYPEGPFDAGPEPTWSDAEEAVRLAESVQTGILAGARSRGISRLEMSGRLSNVAGPHPRARRGRSPKARP